MPRIWTCEIGAHAFTFTGTEGDALRFSHSRGNAVRIQRGGNDVIRHATSRAAHPLGAAGGLATARGEGSGSG